MIRLTEETYILGLEQTGKLFDEDVCRLRSSENYNWCLSRLKDLGFHHRVDEKKHTFAMEHGEHLVFADPREEGHIEVFVYRKETVAAEKKRRGRNSSKYPVGTLKYNISGKMI